MAPHLNLDTGGRVYFTITCDDCHELFACYDDATGRVRRVGRGSAARRVNAARPSLPAVL